MAENKSKSILGVAKAGVFSKKTKEKKPPLKKHRKKRATLLVLLAVIAVALFFLLPMPKHGSYVFENKDGFWIKENYSWGSLDGSQKVFYSLDTILLSEKTYSGGKLEGLTKEWYKSGINKSEKTYRGGKLEGFSREWHESGINKSEKTYRGGKLEGLAKEWYQSSVNKSNKYYNQGVLNGLSKVWYPSGSITYSGNYVSGKINGLWTINDSRGLPLISAVNLKIIEKNEQYLVYLDGGDAGLKAALGVSKNSLPNKYGATVAAAAAKDSNLGGKTGWRLPAFSDVELNILAIIQVLFKGTEGVLYKSWQSDVADVGYWGGAFWTSGEADGKVKEMYNGASLQKKFKEPAFISSYQGYDVKVLWSEACFESKASYGDDDTFYRPGYATKVWETYYAAATDLPSFDYTWKTRKGAIVLVPGNISNKGLPFATGLHFRVAGPRCQANVYLVRDL